MGRKQIKEKRRETVASLYPGMGVTEIADHLGVSMTTIKVDLQELGLTKGRWPEDKRKARKQKILVMHEQGMSTSAIANILNCSRSTVVKHKRDLGISSKPGEIRENGLPVQSPDAKRESELWRLAHFRGAKP